MATEQRLIEVNALIAYFEEQCDIAAKDTEIESTYVLAALKCCIDLFKSFPTVDAVEVVHGRWIFGTANHREYMKCSECLKSQTPTGVFTYCPNCGAKMDGGINHD